MTILLFKARINQHNSCYCFSTVSGITRWQWGEIGSWFAPLFPDALVVSVGGAEPSGNPAGRQWFSVQGITEDNRQARVDAIMPTFY